MRLLLAVFLLLAAAGGAYAYIQSEPDWYVRLRYPLEYEHIVTGHAENYDLDPALLAAVIYRESKFDANAKSSALRPSNALLARAFSRWPCMARSKPSTSKRKPCAPDRSSMKSPGKP